MKIPFAFWGQAESDLPIVGGLKVLNTNLTEAELQFTLIDSGKNEPVYAYGIVYSKTDPNVTLDTPGAQVSTIGTNFPGTLPVTNTHTVTGLDNTSTYYFRVFATNNQPNIPPETIAENTFYSNTATGETAWDAFTFEYNNNGYVQQVPGDQIILGRVYADSGSNTVNYNLTPDTSQQISVNKGLGKNAAKWKVEDESTGNLITEGNFTNAGGYAEIKIDKSLVPVDGKIIVAIAHDDTVPNSTFNNFRPEAEAKFAAIRIRRWGPAKWKVWDYMFEGSNDSSKTPGNNDPGIGTPADIPDLSECVSWQGAFMYNQQAWSGDNPNEQKLGEYDLSNIKVAIDTFKDSDVCGLGSSATTKPLKDANWDNCQIFNNCFNSNNNLKPTAMDNLDLSGWTFNQTDNINMSSMFSGNKVSINTNSQPGLVNWDVGKVIAFESFLSGAQYWDEDLGSWDVSECLNMRSMFLGASNVNFDASSWVVAQVTDYVSFSLSANNWVLPQPNFPFVATNSNIQSAVDAVLAVDPTGTTAVAPYPLIGEWNTTQVTDMSELFRFKQQFNADISNWDVSNVTTMRQMFETASDYNQPLNSWDTSSVTNINKMFINCYDFNQPLNNWNVSNVSGPNTSEQVFENCEQFNQDLDQWDVSNFSSFWRFFNRCKVFNGDITNWQTGSATTMERMFTTAYAFNQDISSWDTSNVTNMEAMFYSSLAFNQPIGGWDVSSVSNMREMFRDAYDFNQPLNSWNVSNVTNMREMFAAFGNLFGQGPGTFDQPLDQWDVSNVTSMSNMFHTQAFNQDISMWNISSLTGDGMSGMFCNGSFNQPLNGWTIPAGVTSLENTFGRSVYDQPLDNWDVSGITNMRNMLTNAEFNQDISGWDVSSVINMSRMLYGSGTKFNQDITEWDTSSLETIADMCYQNTMFDQDLSNWSTTTSITIDGAFRESTFNQPLPNWKIDGSNYNSMRRAFQDNADFNQDISGWDTSDVQSFTDLFSGATSFNQDLSSWDVGNATGFTGMFEEATSYDQSFNGWEFQRNESYGIFGTNFLAGVTLSQANYDDTLIAWGNMMASLYPNGAGSGAGQWQGTPTFDFGDSVHTTGGPAEAGKEKLVNDYNFTITDGNP